MGTGCLAGLARASNRFLSVFTFLADEQMNVFSGCIYIQYVCMTYIIYMYMMIVLLFIHIFSPQFLLVPDFKLCCVFMTFQLV